MRTVKQEIVGALRKRLHLSEDGARETLNAVLDTVREALQEDGDSVILRDFGTFRVISRQARRRRNARTGEEIVLPPVNVLRFTAGKALRGRLNE